MKIKHLLNLTAILVFFAIISCAVEEMCHPRPTTPEGFIDYNKFKITIEQGVSGTLLFQGDSGGPLLATLQCGTLPVTRIRSEESRDGKVCDSTCTHRW